MGEVQVQAQRYVCKICSKICSSGKSLGGHMRVHLALISASKKAAQSKPDIHTDSEGSDDQEPVKLEDSPKNAFPCEESHKNCTNTSDSEEDADRNNNYELRENPKKSWRISDPKHGLSSTASCRECGKEFPTSRALSGHMRSHSIKNKKGIHRCKTCGKGFDSIRAMFGHMKSHSKRLRSDELSSESLSDLENLGPVRKKRSMIRYNYKSSTFTDPSPSFSNLNESEVEEVAEILIMLSRDVRNWSKFDFAVESSETGGDEFGKGKNFVTDADKKVKMSLLSSCKDKNVCGFLGIGSVFVAEDEMKVGKIAKREKLHEFSVKWVSTKSDRVRLSSPVQELAYEMNSSENEASPDEILKGPEKDRKFQCLICFKVFSSGQALGGHKRAHYKTGFAAENYTETEGTNMHAVKEEEEDDEVEEVSEELFDLNFPVAIDESSKRDVQLGFWWGNNDHEVFGGVTN
ncbi:zinc finger protein [Striga asiatica]|uniref:Zinc finger protein n=1 Tax=Striga asiatica TaxID=4170 RepID=A0A5A7QJ01_STRAF|nr:zinc finger protein [Striga asiatica]